MNIPKANWVESAHMQSENCKRQPLGIDNNNIHYILYCRYKQSGSLSRQHFPSAESSSIRGSVNRDLHAGDGNKSVGCRSESYKCLPVDNN
jgi:hypothetical protein